MPQSANRTASASVDFPLPRAPMMQVRPAGILTLRPGRNPPLISIFSITHICGAAGQEVRQPMALRLVADRQHSLLYTSDRLVLDQRRQVALAKCERPP